MRPYLRSLATTVTCRRPTASYFRVILSVVIWVVGLGITAKLEVICGARHAGGPRTHFDVKNRTKGICASSG